MFCSKEENRPVQPDTIKKRLNEVLVDKSVAQKVNEHALLLSRVKFP